MKKNSLITGLLTVSLGLLSRQVAAQDVGIGNTNPQYRLDLSGRARIRGGSDNNNSAGLWLGGTGTDSAINKMFMGMLTDSSGGFYSDQNGTGWFLVGDGRNGRVGIGNSYPKFPLSFNDLSGDKVSLFQDANGNYYGLGIGNATMQLMTPHNTSDILFGYGRSAAFTENMRIKGNGYLGIGVNDPVFRLDIKDRMRIRSGGDANTSPGIYLNNLDNTGIASFVGMQSNNQVGFYGSGGVWGLTMNTDNGNIGIRNPNSNAPLQFANDIRNRKLVLYETANNDHQFYGFGVTSSVLRYQTATTGDDHVFYAGNGTATSNELVRFKGNGNVGFGVADPVFKLDIGGRMRVRSGGNSSNSAGIWLNNVANSASPAFIGMQSDNQVGLFGSGVGWGLSMNTENGAISIGGSVGSSGQILKSNGASASPSWTTAGNIIKTEFAGLLTTDYLIEGSDFKEFTFSAYSVTLNAPSRVILFCKTRTESRSGLLPIPVDYSSRWRLEVWLNGTVSRTYIVDGYSRVGLSFQDNKMDLTTGPDYFDLPAGTHNFTFFATNLFNRSYVALQVTSMIIPL